MIREWLEAYRWELTVAMTLAALGCGAAGGMLMQAHWDQRAPEARCR